jgi:hypothetical protein
MSGKRDLVTEATKAAKNLQLQEIHSNRLYLFTKNLKFTKTI